MDLESFIRKVLLDNALKYEGKTQSNAALGAVMREFPEMRGKNKEVMEAADRLAAEINSLSFEEQSEMLAGIGGSGAPEKEMRDPFHIDHRAPVLRMAPSPSGPMHIGHAYPLGLNHILTARNDGQLIIRIEDTNPDNIYPPAYDLIPEDAQWYTHDGIAAVYIQSDRMELYYSYAERMLSEGWAYICTCPSDDWKSHIEEKTDCPCRSLSPAQNIERWELMLSDFEPGDAVMRVKTDMQHKNPAMRDWPAMRINIGDHPRQGTKYRVWPLMNFSVSVDDIEMGMTHILRAKDHADNAKRQEWMHRYFNNPIPNTYFVGKINFTGLKLSTSETRKLIEEGVYTGWDDIRLPFLPALRRRGFQPEAFLRLAKEMGISPADKTVSKEEYFTNIEAFNREVIDASVDRAFFVPDPVRIVVQGAPSLTIEKDLHPTERPGGRTLHIGPEVWVSRTDLQDADGMVIRLIDAYNFRVVGDVPEYIDEEYTTYKSSQKKRIIQHLSDEDEPIEIKVHMPDGAWVSGKAERRVLDYDEGALLQFERFGFVRLDDKDKGEFWYTHD